MTYFFTDPDNCEYSQGWFHQLDPPIVLKDKRRKFYPCPGCGNRVPLEHFDLGTKFATHRRDGAPVASSA